MIGVSEITIGRAGWVKPQRLQTTPPVMSWRTDGPGTFDCDVSTHDLALAGYSVGARSSKGIKGHWLFYDHRTAGGWGGVVTRTELDGDVVRLTAEQFAVLLRKRRVSSTFPALSISPGSLALYLITSAERQGDTFQLTAWSAEEGGKAVDIEPRGGDLCDDILPELAGYGYQWRVRSDTPTMRAFEFRTRLGQDRRASVLLSEGRNIVHTSLSGDLWTVANSIEGIPGGEFWEGAAGYTQDNKNSIRALGRRYEETIPYEGSITRSTIVPRVLRELAERSYPREIAALDIVDEDMVWREFREGDTVSVQSRSANIRCPMEIDLRTLDVGSGVLSVAGRLMTEAAS